MIVETLRLLSSLLGLGSSEDQLMSTGCRFTATPGQLMFSNPTLSYVGTMVSKNYPTNPTNGENLCFFETELI